MPAVAFQWVAVLFLALLASVATQDNGDSAVIPFDTFLRGSACSAGDTHESFNCILVRQSLQLLTEQHPISERFSIRGVGPNSTLQLSPNSFPLNIGSTGSISFSYVTLTGAAFVQPPVNPTQPDCDFNIKGINVAPGGSFSLSNSVVELDCSDWDVLFDAICNQGFAPGSCKVIDDEVGKIRSNKHACMMSYCHHLACMHDHYYYYLSHRCSHKF